MPSPLQNPLHLLISPCDPAQIGTHCGSELSIGTSALTAAKAPDIQRPLFELRRSTDELVNCAQQVHLHRLVALRPAADERRVRVAAQPFDWAPADCPHPERAVRPS